MQSKINMCRIVEILAKSQQHPLHSPSLFVLLSELRCLKKSTRKRLSQERYVTNEKHQVSQACTNIPATQPIQRFLLALKKEPLLRHLTSQMVHAKYSTKSRALPFESGIHTKLMTYLKTPCTSHNSFDMALFRLSHTQRHTVDQVLNMHYTKRNCRHVTHLDSLQRISDENCMRGQMGEQLDHGQQLEHRERKKKHSCCRSPVWLQLICEIQVTCQVCVATLNSIRGETTLYCTRLKKWSLLQYKMTVRAKNEEKGHATFWNKYTVFISKLEAKPAGRRVQIYLAPSFWEEFWPLIEGTKNLGQKWTQFNREALTEPECIQWQSSSSKGI